jgi:phosphohistidine phosphatase SixA
MRIVCIVFLILAGPIHQSAATSVADQNRMIERLKNGGHILLIRHAFAPGSGDPAVFTIGDCATQRNLDENGRIQARNIGHWLRERGIASARVYSSQWCRCLETANLMQLGPVKELSALNSFYERPKDRQPNISALKHFISQQPVNSELIVFVTHFVTIGAITGESVSSGMGVLLELAEDGPYKVVGRLSFDE